MSLKAEKIDLDNHPLKDAAKKIGVHKVGAERIGEVGFVLIKGQSVTAERIRGMQIGEKDVWVVTYPRSGTTWTQEMIWNIRYGVDVEKSKKVDIDEKFDFLDMDFLVDLEEVEEGKTKFIDSALSKFGEDRNIKSHLPFSLLPQNLTQTAKVVYVGRNPKDVVVSYFHHQRLVKSSDLDLSFEDFVRLFMAELLPEDPYTAHIKEGWAKREEKNVMFLWYEDMKRDTEGAIRKLASFLEKDLSDQDVSTLVDHVSIDNMKKNPAVNHKDRHEKGVFTEGESFIRTGISGGWRKYFSAELEKEFDDWIEQKFSGSGVQFKYQ